MKLAIFDFDGTIYENETFPLLMKHLKEHPTYGSEYKPFYLSALLPYLGAKGKVYPEAKMKLQLMNRYLQIFTGLPETAVNTYFAEIAHKMANNLNTDVLARIKEHSENGFHIMIVSGAFTPLLDEIAKNFSVDTIIGTDIPLSDGFFDSTKQIDHVNGARKRELVHEQVNNNAIDWKNSVAYGDSYSDLSVLELVGNPVAVCPDDKLREVANNKQWEIME